MGPDEYMHHLSSAYCSVMFKSQDEGETWSKYKTKGVGKIEQIIEKQKDYLPGKFDEILTEEEMKIINDRKKELDLFFHEKEKVAQEKEQIEKMRKIIEKEKKEIKDKKQNVERESKNVEILKK